MDAYMNTWREHPFLVGKAYVASQTFNGFPLSEFVAGRSYILKGVGYSSYDSATIFTFGGETDEGPLYWWWYDSDPNSLCLERFRVVA
jgi:hypothetical protein